jgi:choline dehydrogenase-like flavoprotein
MTTVHVFGSLPIANNSDIGLNGELLKDNRVKICDASILPTAPWGNPQAVMMVLNEILLDRWVLSLKI